MSKNERYDGWMKQFYEDKAKRTAGEKYEYFRWFSSKRKRKQYKFSLTSLLFHLKGKKVNRCLEVGCGPGTWTKVLLKKYPQARITCVELSSEMVRQFKEQIKERRITLKNASFLDVSVKKEAYDFVFCSRAIEYIPKKSEVIQKFYDAMQEGGSGIIITSPPHHFILNIKRLFGKKIDKEHVHRISVKDMRYLLRQKGFANIQFYPVYFADYWFIPSTFLFNTLHRRRWGIISKALALGYVVTFSKPERK